MNKTNYEEVERYAEYIINEDFTEYMKSIRSYDLNRKREQKYSFLQ